MTESPDVPKEVVNGSAKVYTELSSSLKAARQNIFSYAAQLLGEDIANPQYNTADIHPDAFMMRANHIGLALFEFKFFSIAEELYRGLLHIATEYRDNTGDWRHVGAFHANIAGACIMQGNLDQAVVELLKAADDDNRTYGVDPQESFAVTGLLDSYFIDPVQQRIIQYVQQIDASNTLADVKGLINNMGDRAYALLAYVELASRHIESDKNFPNDFSKLQIFSALRSVSSLLEVELKRLAGNLDSTLFPTLQSLYRGKNWWSSFEVNRRQVGAVSNTSVSVDQQLHDAIGISVIDDESCFAKSLLIYYIVRNYTVHQLEIQTNLVRSHAQEALAHILHVLVCARNYT